MPTVFDGNSSLSIGAIGAVPMMAALLAQAVPDAGVGQNFAPWTNLAAVTVIVGLFAWLLIHHIPAREKRSEERQDARDTRSEERMDRIHHEFLLALASREETSRKNAESGHQALQTLVIGQRDVMAGIKDVVTAVQHLDRTSG